MAQAEPADALPAAPVIGIGARDEDVTAQRSGQLIGFVALIGRQGMQIRVVHQAL